MRIKHCHAAGANCFQQNLVLTPNEAVLLLDHPSSWWLIKTSCHYTQISTSSKEGSSNLQTVRKGTLVLPWAQVLLRVENRLVSLKLLQMESKTTALLSYGKSHLCEGVLLAFLIFFLL